VGRYVVAAPLGESAAAGAAAEAAAVLTQNRMNPDAPTSAAGNNR